MRVKVGNTWYDGTKEPICVEFSPKDKANMLARKKEATHYAVVNDELYSHTQTREWMDDKIDL